MAQIHIKGLLAPPNMNAFVERLNGTLRREALDPFLLISEKQVRNIVSEFVVHYNRLRPHQGIYRISENRNTSPIGKFRKSQFFGIYIGIIIVVHLDLAPDVLCNGMGSAGFAIDKIDNSDNCHILLEL